MLYTPTPTAPAPEENMSVFLRDIRAIPLLSAQQEQQLAARCVQGDEDAVRTLVLSNLRLVVSVAKEYGGRGVPVMDLIQEGCIGLLAAAKKYDHTRDCRFATYATLWIRQSITRYLISQQSIIRVPAYTAEQLRKIRDAEQALQRQLDRVPTDEELAALLGMEAEKLRRVRSLQPQTVSLDAAPDEEDPIGALLEDIHAEQPQEKMVRQALAQTVEKLLSMLTPRQAQVLRMHYGMDGERRSLEQIGAQLGISKERARQIEKQAIDRLKELGADIGLEDFLE